MFYVHKKQIQFKEIKNEKSSFDFIDSILSIWCDNNCKILAAYVPGPGKCPMASSPGCEEICCHPTFRSIDGRPKG
jgi:hypothetical protein